MKRLLLLPCLICSATAQIMMPGGDAGLGYSAVPAGAPPGYVLSASVFDGSNDWLSRGATPTGLVDGKAGTISFWAKTNGATAGSIMGNTSQHFQVAHDQDRIIITGYNPAGSSIFEMRTDANAITNGSWHHFLASWDLSVSNSLFYVDDVSSKWTLTILNDTIDYANGEWMIGARGDQFDKWNGELCEIYFVPSWLDISTAPNRGKFSSAGIPRQLDDGTDDPPAPLIYLRSPYNNFGNNSGSGGSFTINGALTEGTPPQ